MNLLFFIPKAFAVCPICTIAVGAGVGLSRWLGVDDTITGLWIGAVILSSAFWTESFLEKRKWNFVGSLFFMIVAYYIIVLIPLYAKKIIGHPFNKICGMDKLLFGIILGSVIFTLAVSLDLYIKNARNGKVLFYYQKIVIPIILLLIASLILYFKCQVKI
jgi:ABC-type multidrug transport system fused ATPase/permease subunit